MTSREFAKLWLERQGLLNKTSDYECWLGEAALQIV
jgi:hypothetical protein